MKALGYIRLSKYDEGTTSPQRQRQAIEQLCQARGWELVDTFEDIDVSAYNGKHRPGLDKMLSRLGDVGAVVVYRIDRLARSSVGFARILEALEAARVELAATDLQVDSSAAGTLIRDIVARMAQFESDTLSERAKRMHAYKREQGEVVGRVPFGWRRNGKGFEPVPEQQAVIDDIARRYVAGDSLRRISADYSLHHPNVANMLRSERVLEALPPEVSGRLAQELQARGRTGSRAKRSLLGGIARCGVCGVGMTVVAQKMGNGDRKPSGAYACRERGHVSISRPWLDQYVTAEILAAIDTRPLIKRMEKRRKTQHTRPVSALEARLELLETDFYERGMVTRESYLRRRENLLRQLQQARESEQDTGIDLPRELALHLSEKWPSLSLHGQRGIISAVLQRVEIQKSTTHGKIDPARVALVWRQ